MEFKIVKKGYEPAQVQNYILEVKKVYEEALKNQKDRIYELKNALSDAEIKIEEYKEQTGLVSKAILNAVAKAEEIETLSQSKYNQEIEQLNAFHDRWTGYYNKILDKYPLDQQLAAVSKFNSKITKALQNANNGECNIITDSVANQTFTKEIERLADKQIGYIKIKTQDLTKTEDCSINDIIPDADPNSRIISGDFDPIDRINRYFAAEKIAQKDTLKTENSTKTKKDTTQKPSAESYSQKPLAESYPDRAPSGFSLQECLNPQEDLSQIMKDLGFLTDDKN